MLDDLLKTSGGSTSGTQPMLTLTLVFFDTSLAQMTNRCLGLFDLDDPIKNTILAPLHLGTQPMLDLTTAYLNRIRPN